MSLYNAERECSCSTKKVGVIGIGHAKFGKRTDATIRELAREVEWYEAPTRGKLFTYTLVTFPPDSMTKYAPYIVAVAELEDGSRLLAQITGVSPKAVQVGLPVQVVPHQVSEDRIAYKFKPEQPAS